MKRTSIIELLKAKAIFISESIPYLKVDFNYINSLLDYNDKVFSDAVSIMNKESDIIIRAIIKGL